MIFQEYKKRDENGDIHYTCEDVFGIIDLYSKEKLNAEELDTLVVNILKLSTPQGEIELLYGESKRTIKYTFKALEQWGKDPSDQSTIHGA